MRLTNELRERITKELTKKAREEFQLKIDKLGQMIDVVLKRFTEEDVLKLDEKYKNYDLFKKTKQVSINTLTNNKINLYTYISLNYWYIGFHNKNVDIVSSDDKIQKMIEEFVSLNKEIEALRRKIECVLYKINTSNQLKEQFPEAYDALKEIKQKPSENLCDSFENIRASLSKFNK